MPNQFWRVTRDEDGANELNPEVRIAEFGPNNIVGPYKSAPIPTAVAVEDRLLDERTAQRIEGKMINLPTVRREDREAFQAEREKKRKAPRGLVVSRLTDDEMDALEAADKKMYRRMMSLDNLTTGDKGMRAWFKAAGMSAERIKEVLSK